MKKIIVPAVCILLAIVSICVGIKSDAKAYSQFDDMTAKSYIVIDESGNTLLSKNPNEKHEVASICKLMTTLITLEHLDSGAIALDDKTVASSYACDAEGSQAFLDAGSAYSIRDLIKSVIVASANDSAIVLAETIGGSEQNFVDMMNKKAKEIGMDNTLYANSTGLPDNNQYSTAYDTSLLLNRVSKYQLYLDDCKIWMDTLTHPSGRQTELVNTNRLIKYYPNCISGKTGYTDEAGYCLSSTAIKNDMKLTCVVLGCNTMANRFKESIELYNYAFANFAKEKIVDSSVLIDNAIKVSGGNQNSIQVRPEYDYCYTSVRTAKNDIQINYELPSTLHAPVKKGDRVGNIVVTVNGEVVQNIPVVANENVLKHSYSDVVNKIISNFKVFGR